MESDWVLLKYEQVWVSVSNNCGENGHLLGTSGENHYDLGVIMY